MHKEHGAAVIQKQRHDLGERVAAAQSVGEFLQHSLQRRQRSIRVDRCVTRNVFILLCGLAGYTARIHPIHCCVAEKKA